ncbi:MAG TPA: allantoicase [Flavobacteriales bacterium]|nr:allantoicase [Flavobacteriales bacterium]
MSQPDFTKLLDLAAEKLGGKTLLSSDDFFAPMENLIKPGRGIFIEDKYTDHGKWMDGWESRRKRTPGNDWCILQLGVSGKIEGVDIDTNFFLGNHPPHAALEACCIEPSATDTINWDTVEWTEILPKSPLDAGSQNLYAIDSDATWTHLRLQIYPDGGVARLKVYGEVKKDLSNIAATQLDLVAALNGGRSVLCNDMFFSHMNNLIMPGKGKDMGDGWETKRNRTPNNVDWVIIKFAYKGMIDEIMVDTKHFKGNYPDSCSIAGCLLDNGQGVEDDSVEWIDLLPQSKLSADNEHHFKEELSNRGPFTHVKLMIYPDGGISRLRIYGTLAD